MKLLVNLIEIQNPLVFALLIALRADCFATVFALLA
jgi:hypothetical protein